MKLLNFKPFWYITKAILFPFLLSLVSFFTLMILLQFINKAELFFQSTQTSNYVLQLLFLIGIANLPILIPFCLLFGILFGYGKLSHQNELTALASFGYSKLQLALPALLFSLFGFYLCYSSIHSWGPSANRKSRYINNLLIKKIASTQFQVGVFLNQFPGVTFYSEEKDKIKDKIKKVFILTEKSPKKARVIFSKQAQILDSSSGDSIGMLLSDGKIYSRSKDKDFITTYNKYLIELIQQNSLPYKEGKLTSISTAELKKNQSFSSKLEQNKRRVISLSCFIFCILGLAFSLKLHNRSSGGNGFFTALVFSILFWVLLFAGQSLSKNYHNAAYIYLPLLLFIFVIGGAFYWNKSKSII